MSCLSKLSMLQQCQVLHVVWVCWCIILSQTSESIKQFTSAEAHRPILSLSVEMQKNAGQIPELMEDLSAASSEILGLVNLNEIHSSSAGKLQEANYRGPLVLPCAGSRFLLVNKPGLSQFLPCHRKPFRKAPAHPAFSSGAALTYQAQKWPEFVFCFQQKSSHFICYLSWSKAKG